MKRIYDFSKCKYEMNARMLVMDFEISLNFKFDLKIVLGIYG